jgi:hypothetical protein
MHGQLRLKSLRQTPAYEDAASILPASALYDVVAWQVNAADQ